MNLPVYFNESSKSKYLSPTQIEEFGSKVEAIRREVMESLNEKDAEYIYAVRFIRRGLDEYVLFYKGPVAGDSSLTPEDFFSTFEIKN